MKVLSCSCISAERKSALMGGGETGDERLAGRKKEWQGQLQDLLKKKEKTDTILRS